MLKNVVVNWLIYFSRYSCQMCYDAQVDNCHMYDVCLFNMFFAKSLLIQILEILRVNKLL